MFYVYLLQSTKDTSLYTGYTSNLKQRLKDHNDGKSIATKGKTPYKLIFYEAFLNKLDALNREGCLKSGYGRSSQEKILTEYFKGNVFKENSSSNNIY